MPTNTTASPITAIMSLNLCTSASSRSFCSDPLSTRRLRSPLCCTPHPPSTKAARTRERLDRERGLRRNARDKNVEQAPRQSSARGSRRCRRCAVHLGGIASVRQLQGDNAPRAAIEIRNFHGRKIGIIDAVLLGEAVTVNDEGVADYARLTRHQRVIPAGKTHYEVIATKRIQRCLSIQNGRDRLSGAAGSNRTGLLFPKSLLARSRHEARSRAFATGEKRLR